MRHLSMIVGLLMVVGVAEAAPPKDVPAPLQPWVGWVLKQAGERQCPFLHAKKERQCDWPSRLSLSLGKAGGTFEQAWTLYRRGVVPLPGDAKAWPQDVRVDGRVAPVVERGGKPHLVLPAGGHRVTGRFSWDALPQVLGVPTATGLMTLSLEGRAVPFPRRDAAGGLILSSAPSIKGEKQRLDLVVHRMVVDEVPIEVTTRIKLDVAGAGREVVLDKALLPGFLPMALESKLPARLEAGGKLRLQVRPGKWEVLVRARQATKSDRLQLPKAGKVWPGEEIWVFVAKPKLRLVEVGGVAAVDPQQTTLIDAWKRHSSYRLLAGQAMVLEERRRGDAGTALDQLKLKRNLWLDFDGKGLTIADRLSGKLQRASRLEMQGETTLGRVAVGAKDQFITRHGKLVGVELARGPVEVSAESRYEHAAGDFPAVGWNHDVQALSATLNLPPGWQLFSVSGVDNAPGSWIGRWTLLDMFMVLVLALALGSLFGWKLGVLALLTLLLTFTEGDAPRWVWPFVIVFEALRRALPRGWLQKSVVAMQLIAVLVLLAIAIPFVLQQLRQSIYPALEYPHRRIESGRSYYPGASRGLTLGVAADEAPAQRAGVRQMLKKKGKKLTRSSRSDWKKNQAYGYDNMQLQRIVDPKAVVQTGPGLPAWGWNRYSLRFNGPVRKGERVGLVLLSPAMNFTVGVVRVALIVALLFLLIIVAHRRRPFYGAPAAVRQATATALGLLLMMALGGTASAEYPPSALLEALKEHLTREAPCFPSCASSARLSLQVEKNALTGRMVVDAAARTAVPLPGRLRQWRPQSVSVDGSPADALFWHGEHLWVAVDAGRHRVEFRGALPQQTSVQLSLPLKPHRVEAQAVGWRVDGIHENGLADDTLTLTRSERDVGKKSLQPGELPPFVRITRRVVLGLDWHVETRVDRLVPKGSPIVLSVPLLPGEMVTSERFRVRDGVLQLQMAPEQMQLSWRSSLGRVAKLVLTAPKGASWSESWELAASPIWHVEAKGLPRVHEAADSEAPPAWRPWPGEKLSLAISRPKGIGGQSMTIDGAVLLLRPGRRATDAELRVSLRSSRGGQHTLSVPEGARVQRVEIGGTSYPVRQDGRRVTLPISPGKVQILIKWRQPEAMGLRYVVPAISLGARAVNAEVRVEAPRSRWVLLTGGVRVGPVVLFWSLLFVLLVVAIGLARLPWTPLRAHQWLLLAIGLSQVPILAAAIVAGWLLVMGWREKSPDWAGPVRFDLRQIGIGIWLIPALVVLFAAIHRGLLGHPDMQIEGNGSSAATLRWFVDRVGEGFPRPWTISVPLWVYRVLMLLWALWLAWSLVGWSRWAWRAFKQGGLWKRSPPPPRPPRAVAMAGVPAAMTPEQAAYSQQMTAQQVEAQQAHAQQVAAQQEQAFAAQLAAEAAAQRPAVDAAAEATPEDLSESPPEPDGGEKPPEA